MNEAYSSVPYLLDRVDVGGPLLDGRDGHVGILGGLGRLLQPLGLVRLEVLFHRYLVVLLDVDRVVGVELVLTRAADDDARHAQPVGEPGELHLVDL